MGSMISVKVDGLDRIKYEAQTGVVVGKNFLSKSEFRKWFEELLNAKDSQEYMAFATSLESNMKKIMGAGDQEITKFSKNLNEIQSLFLKFTAQTNLNGALGGEIGLLTTFAFGKNDQETYFLANENDLPSRIRQATGGKAFTNSRKALNNLVETTEKAVKMNSSFQQHLQNFYVELQDSPYDEKDRKKLYIWAYQNMKNRFNENRDKTPMSLARYFWGEGKLHGYVSEAYGSHLMLTHSNFLVDEHTTELKKSVIEEHGGRGSKGLFALLASTKGNTSSQLSGDIVIIDNEGRVKFNIQSKASINNSYGIYITYQQFLTNVSQFLTIYKNWDLKSEKEKNQDIEFLFKAFSTTAWVPLQEKINANIQEEFKKVL